MRVPDVIANIVKSRMALVIAAGVVLMTGSLVVGARRSATAASAATAVRTPEVVLVAGPRGAAFGGHQARVGAERTAEARPRRRRGHRAPGPGAGGTRERRLPCAG